NAARRRNVPSAGIRVDRWMSTAGGAGSDAFGGFVFRWAFRHHPVRHNGESLRTERPLQDDFGSVLERVGDDPRVASLDDLALAFDPEAILERVRLPFDGLFDDEAVQLHALALHSGRL